MLAHIVLFLTVFCVQRSVASVENDNSHLSHNIWLPNQCDTSTFSGYLNNSVTPNSACFLNSPYKPQCDFWKISTMGVMLNNTPNIIIQHVQNFVYGILKNCDTNSESEFYSADPAVQRLYNDNCTTYNIGSIQEQYFLASMNPNASFVQGGKNPGEVMAGMLENFMKCTLKNPLKPNEGGVLLIVTNIPCTDLCTEQLINAQNAVFRHALTHGYVAKVIYLNDDGTSVDCLKKLFKVCSTQSKAYCEVEVFGNSTTALDSNIKNMTVCELPLTKTPMPRVELISLITVPIVCIIIVTLTLFIMCHRRKRFRDILENGTQEDLQNAMCKDELKKTLRLKNHFSVRDPSSSTDGWEIYPDELILDEDSLIGSGAFASVYKGRMTGKIPLFVLNPSLNMVLENRTESILEVAVKKITKIDEESRSELFHEINIMKNIGFHPHIICMLGCITTPEPTLVIEYCELGDLLSFVRKHRNILNTPTDKVFTIEDVELKTKDLVSIAWQVCDGLTYLSSHNFIHCDVAARNVLLTKNMVAKLGDFGLCRFSETGIYTAKNGRLPIKWMAIESLKYYDFTTESDVWSYGVLLFELFSMGDGPYPAIQPDELLDYLTIGKRMKRPKTCPVEIYKIMKRCWLEQPKERPKFNQIRSELALMLNLEDEHYGYIDVQSDFTQTEDSVSEELQIDLNEEKEERTFRNLLTSYWKSTKPSAPKIEEEPPQMTTEAPEVTTGVGGRILAFLNSIDPTSLFEIENIAREYRTRGNVTHFATTTYQV